jgi:hypothetical protein
MPQLPTYTYEELSKIVPESNLEQMSQLVELLRQQRRYYSLDDFNKLNRIMSDRLMQLGHHMLK